MQIQQLPSNKCTLKESTALARQYEMVKSQLNNPVQQVLKKEEEELTGRVANEEEEETVNRVKARAQEAARSGNSEDLLLLRKPP